MKKYIENWRKFLLLEQKESIKIFEDMDGCLIDFINPILKKINDVFLHPESFQNQELLHLVSQVKENLGDKKEITLKDIKESGNLVIHELLFKVIEDDVDFWSGLPWKSDGKELWQYITSNFKDVYILSSPARGKGKDVSIEGKRIWIQKNLNISLDRCIFESNKYKYASPNSVLIDDYSKNINEWSEHNGIAILHRNTKNTIDKLNKLL